MVYIFSLKEKLLTIEGKKYNLQLKNIFFARAQTPLVEKHWNHRLEGVMSDRSFVYKSAVRKLQSPVQQSSIRQQPNL